jgi:acetyl esterase/lipase
MTARYDPTAAYDIRIWEEDFRRAPARMLRARIWRPVGDGPFPVLLDLHGGAWANKDRTANVAMAEAMARSGILTAAVDMRVSGEAPYPAAVQDANYAVRWLKMKAPGWGGDPATAGVLGSSTGGHVALLLGMRPNDARYNAIPLEGINRKGGAAIDARVAYVAARSPISDPLARYGNARAKGREKMVNNHRAWFDPWSAIEEANPQMILDRGETVALPPLLIMQGGLDDNVLPKFQVKFAESWRAAGGEVELEVFEGCSHLWVLEPGPDTDRAHETLKAFIARQMRAVEKAA